MPNNARNNAAFEAEELDHLSLPSITLRWSIDTTGPIHVPAGPCGRLSLLWPSVRADVASHEALAEVRIALPKVTISLFLFAHLAFSAHLFFTMQSSLLLLC
jgi:hypothetical protein